MTDYNLPARLPKNWHETDGPSNDGSGIVAFEQTDTHPTVTVEVFGYDNRDGYGVMLTTPGPTGTEMEYESNDTLQGAVDLAYDVMVTVNTAKYELRL